MTRQPMTHMRLEVGLWYMVLAPVYDIWDAMTLLPASAHIAIVVGALIAYLTWNSRRLARRRGRVDWRGLAKATGALAALVAWYALGAVVARPMASLRVDDPDLVVVDFHSHTEASHDGRRWFTAESNRDWHLKAGYNVAYVTDHGTFESVPGMLAGNPGRAGDGMVLLPGFETRYAGLHLNVLGFAAESTYRGLPSTELASFSGRPRPPAVLTIPGNLQTALSSGLADGPILGVEVVDGSPRGLAFGMRQRAALEDLATRVHAPVVVGSNNHGWGRAAPGWTVIRIPDWRRMTPRALDAAILEALAAPEPGRVIAVERVPPEPVDERVLVADVTVLLRNPFRTLSRREQLAWVCWTWIAWLVAMRRRRSRAESQLIPSSAR